MTIHLPEELESFVRSEVRSGRYASEGEAISEALRLLRQRRQEPPAPSNQLTEEEFEKRLMQSGFLGSIPVRPLATTPCRDFQPITIKDEPLSETVIRERR